MSSTAEINDCLQFLDVLTPPKYKNQILEYILGMTGTAQGVKLISENQKLLCSLKTLLLQDSNEDTRLNCLRIVVNITSGIENALIFQVFMENIFVTVLLRTVTDPQSECSDLIAMLLTNLTQTKTYAEAVLTIVNKIEDFTIKKYVDALCIVGYNKRQCSLHHLGAFLANLTLFKEARDYLLADKACLLVKLLPFTQYEESITRRMAAARIIKNCLLETDCHELMLSDDIDLLPHLLLPLAGPEEFTTEENDSLPLDLQYLPATKKREQNQEIQILLCDCLFQLCATKKCRVKMKNSGTYYILREMHRTLDNNSNVIESIENLIQTLISEEPDPDKENLRTVEIPPDVQRKFEMLNNAVEE